MLRGVIVGFGKIARGSHMPAYMADSILDRVKIIAVVDPDPEIKNEVEENYPEVKYYSSLQELLLKDRPDFIDICSPPAYHLESIKTAIENNIHIICEKPLSVNLSETKNIYALLKDKSLVYMPCHQYKYSQVWKAFKSTADDIIIEDKHKMLIQINVYRTNADNGFFNSNPSWRTDRQISGGGILSDTGVHYLYLAEWFMEKQSVNVVNTKLFHDSYNVEDTSLVTLELESGICQINLTWAADKRENSAMLTSRKRSLAYNGDSIIANIPNKVELLQMANAADKSTYIKMYEELFNEFILRITENNFSKDGLSESLCISKLLTHCYKSAELRKTIAVKR